MRPLHIFISYTHDSKEHRDRVLALAERLRTDGLFSMIDRYINGHPEEGWLSWMERQISQANFVLIVCSPTYYRRYMGEEIPGHGLGGVWESGLIQQALYKAQGKNRKFVPVLFEGASIEDIPNVLRYRYTHYLLMKSYDELLRFLTSQPEVNPSPVKATKIFPAPALFQQTSELPFAEPPSESDDQFSPTLSNHMALLKRKVEYLTQEQFRIIWMLRYLRRVRISGCAGSGKTLVAAEKAIRLSKAGLRTLFLCHNPLLAKHVAQLTQGSGVEVRPFGSWVTQLIGRISDYNFGNWTNYEEPDSQTLENAFDVLVERGPRFDAVIVDEGQDFRDEWWAVVEASLNNIEANVLYIFHDDHQALLPHRATYPIKEPPINLSRNCRNAGKIFELMRYLHPDAPMPEQELKDQGKILVISYAAGSERESVEKAIRWLLDRGYGENFVLLLGGSLTVENSSLSGAKISIPTTQPWQDEVKRMFEYAFQKTDPRGIMFPIEGEQWIKEELNNLSQDPLPNPDDIELVRNIVRKFNINHAIRSQIDSHPQISAAMRWVVKDGQLRLYRSRHVPIWSAEIIRYFEREDWAAGLPQPRVLTLRSYDSTDETDFVKMYNVANYKGLESDVVLLLVRGRGPMIEQQMYVGISRARFLLAVLIDKGTSSLLPQEWITEVHAYI